MKTRLDTLVTASAQPPAAPSLLHDAARVVHATVRLEAAKKAARVGARHVAMTDPDARGYLVAGLLGEAGELAKAVIEGAPIDQVLSECGDVLWQVTAIANHVGATLSDAAEALRQKMVGRHADRMAANGFTDRAGSILAPDVDQPRPTPGEGDIWQEIINDLADGPLRDAAIARRELGIARYGVPLQRNNGRDPDRDLLEELLDAIAYARAARRPGVEMRLVSLASEVLYDGAQK